MKETAEGEASLAVPRGGGAHFCRSRHAPPPHFSFAASPLPKPGNLSPGTPLLPSLYTAEPLIFCWPL